MKNRTYSLIAIVLLAAGALAQTSDKDNHVDITVRGDYRYITANGIPNHRHGDFPNRGNPNTIRAQSYTFRVPAKPKLANEVTSLGMNPFGIAVNGVPFDPGAAEWWNNDPSSGWQYEALSGKINLGMDQNNAHVQPNGAYHYHGLPTGLIEQLGDGKRMVLIGYAADGFPIYEQYGYKLKDIRTDIIKLRSSYRLKTGTRPNGPGGKYDGTFVKDYEYVAGAGELDQCNGREGVTPEYLDGTYYYVITSEFPFIPRCFRGTPDDSFKRRGPGGPPRRPPVARPPRN
jgi:hypothetical protein